MEEGQTRAKSTHLMLSSNDTKKNNGEVFYAYCETTTPSINGAHFASVLGESRYYPTGGYIAARAKGVSTHDDCKILPSKPRVFQK